MFHEDDRIRNKNRGFNTPEQLKSFYQEKKWSKSEDEEYMLVVEKDKVSLSDLVETLSKGGFKVQLEDFRIIRLRP